MSNQSEQALQAIEPFLDDLSDWDAYDLYLNLKERFNWFGAVGVPGQIRTKCDEYRHEAGLDYEDDRIVEAKAEQIYSDKHWRYGLEEYLEREIESVVRDAVSDLEWNLKVKKAKEQS